jgi:hypothetical protein
MLHHVSTEELLAELMERREECKCKGEPSAEKTLRDAISRDPKRRGERLLFHRSQARGPMERR